MESGIYVIRVVGGSAVYVGSAVRLLKRWAVHQHLLRKGGHHCPALQRAFKKHGSDNVSFEVLERCEREALIEREQWWFTQFPKLYNVLPIAGSRLGVRPTAGALAKQSATMRARLTANPMHVEAMMAGKRRFHAENPTHLSERAQQYWSSEEVRAAQAERARKQFDKPGMREAAAERARKSLTDPAALVKKLASLHSPEARLKQAAAMRKRAVENPGIAKAHGEKMKAHYEGNDEARERQRQVAKKAWADPTYRAAAKERMKQLWADPVFRAKVMEARRNGKKKCRVSIDSLT